MEICVMDLRGFLTVMIMLCFLPVFVLLAMDVSALLTLLPLFLIWLDLAVRCWHCRLIFNAETGEISYQDFGKKYQFSVDEIQSVSICPCRNGENLVINTYTQISISMGRKSYNMEYFETFLKNHSIIIQEAEAKWH